MKTPQSIALTILTLAASAVFAQADYGGYKGVGGMAAYAIKPNVYAYHYDKGFTGPDASGWDPNLQFIWSRIGAAQAYKVPYDDPAVFKLLKANYPHGEMVHRMVGIDFHAAQSKAQAAVFCSVERVAELRTALPAFERGEFAKAVASGK